MPRQPEPAEALIGVLVVVEVEEGHATMMAGGDAAVKQKHIAGPRKRPPARQTFLSPHSSGGIGSVCPPSFAS